MINQKSHLTYQMALFDVYNYFLSDFSINIQEKPAPGQDASSRHTLWAGGRKRMKELIANKYSMTLHIDNDSILETHNSEKDFEEHEIKASEEEWSKQTIAIIEEIEKRADKK